MRRQAFDVRVWLSIAGVGLCLLVGCDELDPVKTESLCDRKLVSMRCPQCQNAPYAAECSVCAGTAKNDPEMCKSETSMSPGTNGGRGGGDSRNDAGEGGSGSGAESGTGGESNGSSGTGGNSEAGAGSGGMSGPMGGAGANAPPDGRCASDTDCKFRDPSKPGCEMLNKVCVQCTLDQHCTGDLKVCNLAQHRCANCASDHDCGTKKCDTAKMLCVECQEDPDCNTDPVMNQCDMRDHLCVDCMTNSGCDDAVNGTCDTNMHSCVDCLGDGDCTEDGKPACDRPNRTCVGCLVDVHCRGDRVLGTCDSDARTCVDCLDDSGCSAPDPRCDTSAQKCVQCLEGTDCASGHCIGQQCVECEEDMNCLDPTKSHCNASTHECEGCSSNSQCGHLAATKACDIQNSKCVQCTDETTCANKACIRAQHTCSNVGVNSVDVCLPCQADAMCKTNSKCVALTRQGQTYGNYCVFTRQSRSGGTCANARPYTQSFSARTIDSATSSSYCVPISTTSCPGVLDVAQGASGKACSMNSECGLGMGDAICSDGKCTYGCTIGNDEDCPEGLSCLPNAICG
jgi:hypothetical protein